jgi:hypothetical protein
MRESVVRSPNYGTTPLLWGKRVEEIYEKLAAVREKYGEDSV